MEGRLSWVNSLYFILIKSLSSLIFKGGEGKKIQGGLEAVTELFLSTELVITFWSFPQIAALAWFLKKKVLAPHL